MCAQPTHVHIVCPWAVTAVLRQFWQSGTRFSKDFQLQSISFFVYVHLEGPCTGCDGLECDASTSISNLEEILPGKIANWMSCWVNRAPVCVASHREAMEAQQIPNRFQWTIRKPVSMSQASGECFVPLVLILGSPGCPVSSKLHDRVQRRGLWSSASNYFVSKRNPNKAPILPTMRAPPITLIVFSSVQLPTRRC